jgi:hypothetical protein
MASYLFEGNKIHIDFRKCRREFFNDFDKSLIGIERGFIAYAMGTKKMRDGRGELELQVHFIFPLIPDGEKPLTDEELSEIYQAMCEYSREMAARSQNRVRSTVSYAIPDFLRKELAAERKDLTEIIGKN